MNKYNNKKIALTIFVSFFIFLSSLSQGVFTSKATANWSTGTTTAFNLTSGSDADGIPDADDDVIIASGHTITVNGVYACNTLVINAAGVANGISLTSPNSLTVGSGNGSVTMNASTAAAVNSTIAVGSGTLNCGAISITGSATASRNTRLTISTGTINCTGITYLGTAAQAQVIFSGAGFLKIATGTLGTGGTFTCSTGTVEFTTLTGEQTVNAYTYYNLKHNNTSGTNSATGNISMTGTLTTTSGGIFDLGTFTLSGAFTANNSGILKTSNTSVAPLTPNLNWGGTVEYALVSGGQKIMRGTYNNLTLLNSSGSNTTSAATVTVNGAFVTTSGGVFAPGFNVALNGTTTCSQGTIGATLGTITYGNTSGGQNIITGTYVGMTQSNTSGTNTACGNIIMTGSLTTAAGGTFNLSTFSLSGALTPVNAGIIKTSNTSATPITTGKTWTGTIEYGSASAQTLMAGTYNDLIISGGGSKTLSAAVTIGASGILTLTSGIIIPGAFVFTHNNTASTAISGGSTVSYVSGILKRKIASGTGDWIFPVGIGGTYYPFTLTNPTQVTGYSSVSVTAASTGGSAGTCNASISSTEYWTLTTTTNLSVGIITLGKTSIGANNAVSQSTGSTLASAYNSLYGTISGNSIISTSSISVSNTTSYFTLSEASATSPTLTTPTSASIKSSIATLGGNLTNLGCTNVTEKGIYYSTTNGFSDGSGTKVSTTSSAHSTGVFTIAVPNLTPSTIYYYKAFATNSNGSTYTTQGTFTTTAQTFPVTESFEGDASGTKPAGTSTALGSFLETSSWSINNNPGGCLTNNLRIASAITNQWYFTPFFYATAGKVYTTSYQGKNTASTATINIYSSTLQSSASANLTSDYFTGAGSGSSYASESSLGWLCPSTGTYCFGFKVTSGTSALQIDCISIAETTPATITWTGGASTTNWSTASNWDLARVPNSSDIIVIPTGLSYYPSTVPSGSYNSLSLTNGASGGTTTINATSYAGDLTLLSSSTNNTITIASDLSVGGNISVGTSGSAFNFNCNGTITGTGSLTLGNTSTALTSTFNAPISVNGAFTMANNSANITNISYATSTSAIAAIRSSNSGAYTFYGAVNYTATSGDQIVMKPQYNGAVTCSGSGNRFMEGDLDINSSLTISGGKWYSGNPNEQGVSGALGSDANAREAVSPYKGAATDGKFQMIFKSSFMSGVTATDLLTSLSFYVLTKSSSNPYKNFTIKLGLTTDNSFAGSSMAGFTYLTPTTTVFGPTDVTTVANSWNTHTFTTPFEWDGSSNLLVEITFDNVGFSGPSGTDLIAYFSGGFADDIIAYNSSFACGSIHCPTYNEVTMTSNSNFLGKSIFNIADGPYNINITNDWNNSGGIFYHLTNTVTFDGATSQNVTTRGDNFYNYIVNNTNATEALTLLDDCNIEGTATLTDGIVKTDANKFICLSTTASKLTGYSNVSFVYGNLKRYIGTNTSTYGLPLGNGTSTTNYYLSEIINNSLTGTAFLDTKFVTGTPADYNQVGFAALSKQMTGTGVTTKTLLGLDSKGYFQIDPDLQPSGGTYSIKMYNTNYTLGDWSDNDQCIVKRPSASASMGDFNMAGTINADGGLGRLVANGYLQSNDINSFSILIPAQVSASPLPIELLSFTLTPVQKNALANWKTKSEVNADYYTLEKTKNGKDFEFVTKVKASGNSYQTTNYSFKDEHPYLGISYYRLKQYDYDGKFVVYPLRTFELNNSSITVFPNPLINNSFSVNFDSNLDQQLTMRLYNNLGQLVYTDDVFINTGDVTKEYKLNLLNKGEYYLEVISEQFGVTHHKLIAL